MSKIIPISITTTEQTVELDATYQFVWLRNMGDNDALLSDHSGIVAGDDNVTLVKAGESGRIATSGRAVYIKAVSGTSTGEIHAQNFSDAPFKSKAKGGGQTITVEPLTVTDNGVYTAPTGKAYSPVTVDVQEQPWQPLQDGYSNFWFELTNDTLSPWLNFSAKTNDAVIDWGDGSGEVALDTLTPTHTYSKAGKYVVKVKGVTGIGRQHTAPYSGKYFPCLIYAELNSEVASLNSYAFFTCTELKKVVSQNANISVANHVFYLCPVLLQSIFSVNYTLTKIDTGLHQTDLSLQSMTIPNTVTEIANNAFTQCMAIREITIPTNVVSIGNSVFQYCGALAEIHVEATTPPTLGTNVFGGIASNYIIYVPVGYAETYKAASGWSTYADHILEEGQTPNRAMLAKFNSAKTDEPQDDMR
jgi:hypothetical protein